VVLQTRAGSGHPICRQDYGLFCDCELAARRELATFLRLAGAPGIRQDLFAATAALELAARLRGRIRRKPASRPS
jgi:hypothetical protein